MPSHMLLFPLSGMPSPTFTIPDEILYYSFLKSLQVPSPMACYKTALRVGRTLTQFCYNIGFKNSTLFQCACYLGEQYKDNTNLICSCAIKHPTECRKLHPIERNMQHIHIPQTPPSYLSWPVCYQSHPSTSGGNFLISANLLPFHNNHKRQFSFSYFHKPTSSFFQCQTPYLQ